MPDFATNIPASRVPLIDANTNTVSREWYAFFLNLFQRSGAEYGADGDKGDVVVSGNNSVWTIDDGAVSTAKLGGDITPAGKAILNDLTAAIQRRTLGIDAANTPYTPRVISHWPGNVDPGDVDNALDKLAQRIHQLRTRNLFPVGALFASFVDTDPRTLLGYGEWERVAVGRFIVGLDESDPDFSTVGQTGGSKT